nr:RNA-directed DNA polymerase, eukaryota [Tanacetum cinerariifolium]
NVESDSDIDAVSDTCFGESGGNLDGDIAVEQPVNDGLGSKAKKDWIRELIVKHKIPTKTKLLVVSVYALQALSEKRILFDQFITCTWNSISLDDRNGMVRFKKKLQLLKKEIKKWVSNRKHQNLGRINEIKANLIDIDRKLDQGGGNDNILLSRVNLMKQLPEFKASDTREFMQKAKVQWAIEGDKNSRFFHGILNKKRATLSIQGVMVDGDWVVDPIRVKEVFRSHFASGFNDPGDTHCKINCSFPNCLSSDQVSEMECQVSNDGIRQAVWGCGDDKSPGPDGFSSFLRGCNSSFVSLSPKISDPKFVSDFRPISLIGCLYKVVNKILATRLSVVISGLILDVQTAFVPNRQILDGPFIVNELLDWCKRYKHQAMVFKVDFAKAYDSIRWDYLIDVLRSFGFGDKWCSWIKGCLYSNDAIFIEEWSEENLNQILQVLHCFSLASGLKINVHKSQLLGVGIPLMIFTVAASVFGCSVMTTSFKYLGVM